MDIGPTELLIILFIVILIFGPGRLSKVGGELGKAIHSFREGIMDTTDEAKPKKNESSQDKKEDTPDNEKPA
ncbi:MAG: Sec-independent protein translocase subunit TatA/TatB [Anaerolineales bacterium]